MTTERPMIGMMAVLLVEQPLDGSTGQSGQFGIVVRGHHQ